MWDVAAIENLELAEVLGLLLLATHCLLQVRDDLGGLLGVRARARARARARVPVGVRVRVRIRDQLGGLLLLV